MCGLKSFWGSATTRAIAVVSVIGLFIVYLIRAWRRSGAGRSLQRERENTIGAFAKRRVELKGRSIEEINTFESELYIKLSEIESKAQTIRDHADHSRKRLADALNKSFGR